jgi:hypothetical protein
MLMKLVLPHFSRMFPGGYVQRWFKREGDRIGYGEDLFDLRVEEARVTNTIRAAKPAQWLKQLAQQVPETAAVPAAAAPERSPEQAPATAPGFRTWRVVVLLRINSSDVGYLRRIEVTGEDYLENGGLVALMTTEADEPLPPQGEDIGEAGIFRVVANMVDMDEE